MQFLNKQGEKKAMKELSKGKNKESIITAECPYCGAITKFRKLGSAPIGKVKIRCQRCKSLFNYSEIIL